VASGWRPADREIQSRFGRENLGFAWTVAEPLVFAPPVLLMWRMIRATHEHGLLVMPFLWSGYLPLLLFCDLGGRILLFIRQNPALLYHRQVTILDIFIARSLLEIGSNLTAPIVPIVVFYILGAIDVSRDLPMFYVGYFFMAWWAVAIALIIGALSESTDWVQQIRLPYSYMYIMFSGFFDLADWLPPRLRAVALYPPYTQAYATTVKTYAETQCTRLAFSR
jgi:capsular polysaccharide transport system permease protein